jgi:hypothetical protein
MSELFELGYPQGYHMGFSAILWWISIIILAILVVILYLNAKKSDLINVKEMLLSKAIAYVCATVQIILFQVGVFYPDYFIQFYLFGASLITISIAFYFYYWEKNLTSIRWIPTYSAVAASTLAVVGFTISLFSYDLVLILVDFLVIMALSLVSVAAALYIYLIFIFSKNVKGIKLYVGVIWMVGMALAMIGWSFEFPPGAKIFPSFIVLYLAPLTLVIGLSFATYGITTLFAKISSYYAQTQKCAVHRGTIEKGNIIFFCPYCGITYCESCYEQVIKKDGCWNCHYGAEIEIGKEWKVEEVIEVKKDTKSKHKTPK